jgi:general secretion pathway protein C
LPAEWLNSTNDLRGRVSGVAQHAAHNLRQPEQVRRIRQLLLLLFGLWLVLALVKLLWAFVPEGDMALPAEMELINPVLSQGDAGETREVDIARLRDWHLFGEADALTPEQVAEMARAEEEAARQATDRDGIEEGARETRLALKLRGVVASTEDGLGHAIIEHQNKQEVYAVEDQLPVSGVTLAKVMPGQVVLDNSGTYELLRLFEENEFDKQVQEQARRPTPRAERKDVDRRSDAGATRIARNYRDQLYQNPQSLAKVVKISAVREEGELRGYRVRPGADQREFARLGFRPGDLVTGVNGIALDDPANTMRLYQVMRSASEAVFELERGGQPLSLTVALGSGDLQE